METSGKADAARLTGVSLVTAAINRSQGQDRARSTGRSGKKFGQIGCRKTGSETELKKSERRQLVTSYFSASPCNRQFYYNIAYSVKHENNCFIISRVSWDIKEWPRFPDLTECYLKLKPHCCVAIITLLSPLHFSSCLLLAIALPI